MQPEKWTSGNVTTPLINVREALRYLLERGLAIQLSDPPAPPSELEVVAAADRNALRRIFDSVKAEVVPAQAATIEPRVSA
jgi:hypothetical protein